MGGGLDQVQAGFRETAARLPEIATSLPAALVADQDQAGWSHRYGASAQGEMILLDPEGVVVTRGANAPEAARQAFKELAREYEARRQALGAASTAADVEAGIRRLLALELPPGEVDLAIYVTKCPGAVLPMVLDVVLGLDREDLVLREARSEDDERRATAFDLMEARPRPAWAPKLIERAQAKGTKPDDVARMLTIALASDAGHPDLEPLLLDLTRKGTVSVRRRIVPLLGRLGTVAARERLLVLLVKGTHPLLRRGAAEGLATWSDDEVRAALERAAASDKNDEVRTAAREALTAAANR